MKAEVSEKELISPCFSIFFIFPRDLMSHSSISLTLRLDIKKTSELIIYEEEIDSFAWISPLKIYSRCRFWGLSGSRKNFMMNISISETWTLQITFYCRERERERVETNIVDALWHIVLSKWAIFVQEFLAHKKEFQFSSFLSQRARSAKKTSAS